MMVIVGVSEMPDMHTDVAITKSALDHNHHTARSEIPQYFPLLRMENNNGVSKCVNCW